MMLMQDFFAAYWYRYVIGYDINQQRKAVKSSWRFVKDKAKFSLTSWRPSMDNFKKWGLFLLLIAPIILVIYLYVTDQLPGFLRIKKFAGNKPTVRKLQKLRSEVEIIIKPYCFEDIKAMKGGGIPLNNLKQWIALYEEIRFGPLGYTTKKFRQLKQAFRHHKQSFKGVAMEEESLKRL